MLVAAIVIYWILEIYFFILILRMLLSWIPLFAPQFQPKGILLVLFEAIYTLTDPPLKLLRKFMPSPNMGGVRLDLSFLVVFLFVVVLQNVIRGWIVSLS